MKILKKPKKSFFSKVGSIILGEAKDLLGESIVGELVSANPIVDVIDVVTFGAVSDAIDSSTEKAADKLNEMKKKSKNKVQKDEPINKVKENESNSEYNIKSQKPMYNEKLDKLIEMALMDGVITEKERKVLYKKAHEMGVDIDEFEMVLDAKLVEKQKQGAPVKKKDNVIKCPSCNDIIPALSRVCPSCEYVIDARKQSSGSEKGLEDLINDIEEILVEIKSKPQRNVFSSFINHSFITISLLTIIVGVIGVKLEMEGFMMVALAMAIISIVLIRKRIKSKSEKEDSSANYANQKALFEKHSRTANTLFGDNKKVKLLVNDLKDELNKIEQDRNKNKKIEIVAYVVLVLLTIGVFLIPSKKTHWEIEVENEIADKELIIVAEELIENNKLDDAKLIIKDLKTDESIVILKSKLQLSKLTAKLDALEPLLEEKKYSKVKLELDKITWQKISTDYSTRYVEEDFYSTFIKYKGAINNQLPEKYKLKIETEESL